MLAIPEPFYWCLARPSRCIREQQHSRGCSLCGPDHHGVMDHQRQCHCCVSLASSHTYQSGSDQSAPSVWAGIQGQEAGNSLVDILWGAVNPSGRLPYTIAKAQSDYGANVATGGGTINYSEGLFIDYRYFDKVIQLLLLLHIH